MGGERRHVKCGANETIADLGETRLLVHRSAGGVVLRDETGKGRQMRSLGKLREIDFGEQDAGGGAPDAGEREQQMEVVRHRFIRAQSLLQLTLYLGDLLVKKGDALVQRLAEERGGRLGGERGCLRQGGA